MLSEAVLAKVAEIKVFVDQLTVEINEGHEAKLAKTKEVGDLGVKAIEGMNESIGIASQAAEKLLSALRIELGIDGSE